MTLRVIVDRDKCCGAGQCVMLVPDVFDQEDEGTVILLDPTPPESLHAAAREAACVCPGGAIRVDESG
ncbi:ferredoxin [Paraliomyxa miuraensis]|uniref:ferredoxin n=1 Tax=Paraliomyxa miuraensis TaxID=376150 RepID=UPI00225456E0|nr:ferredoxin [Paraliomyxa miuraensis]MCX4243667.1 ferredoxin [Paraliomyxa miuraensis]